MCIASILFVGLASVHPAAAVVDYDKWKDIDTTTSDDSGEGGTRHAGPEFKFKSFIDGWDKLRPQSTFDNNAFYKKIEKMAANGENGMKSFYKGEDRNKTLWYYTMHEKGRGNTTYRDHPGSECITHFKLGTINAKHIDSSWDTGLTRSFNFSDTKWSPQWAVRQDKLVKWAWTRWDAKVIYTATLALTNMHEGDMVEVYLPNRYCSSLSLAEQRALQHNISNEDDGIAVIVMILKLEKIQLGKRPREEDENSTEVPLKKLMPNPQGKAELIKELEDGVRMSYRNLFPPLLALKQRSKTDDYFIPGLFASISFMLTLIGLKSLDCFQKIQTSLKVDQSKTELLGLQTQCAD